MFDLYVLLYSKYVICKTVNVISMFCKSTRYKCSFKHVFREFFVIVLGMQVVLGWLRIELLRTAYV